MTSRQWETEVTQIENIAETKGVDVEDIEVEESTTDEGDQLVSFRVYSEDGPKVQITKMPSVPTADMTFRDDVQSKLSALKRAIGPEQEDEDADDAEAQSGNGSSTTPDASNESVPRSVSDGDGPGSQIDAELQDLRDRVDDLEDRIEAIEDKAEALDGLQQLMQGSEE